jgi:serine protease Do
MISARSYKSQMVVLATALLWILPAAFAAPANSGAYLGVHISDITPELANNLRLSEASGVVVLSIDHDGPACKAGIMSNDVIVSVAGAQVRNIQQMVQVMNTMAAGSVANITILRDGSPQSVNVTLGSRKNWMAATPAPMPNSAVAKSFANPMPSVAYPNDVELPLMTPASARRGIVVEGLTPQLAEFFGVPSGQGVLVRNVQRGSIGANAGLKAGDVIIKIDGQAIRDLADWRRSMNISNGKTQLSIIREKREQAVEMVMPGPSGELRVGDDWDSFDPHMDAFNQQMQLLRPQIEKQTQALMFSNDELEKTQREMAKSVDKEVNKQLKRETKELKHQTKEIQKQMKDLEPQLRKQSEEMQKQMEQMRPEIEKQTQAVQKDMEKMRPEIQKQAEEITKTMAVFNDSLKTIGPQVQEQIKVLGPQIQQQMQELQKEMQQQQQQWHDMMKNWPKVTDQPNQM